MKDIFKGKVVLVTGGTGSFGKKFTEVVIKRHKPKKLIIFSRDEMKQYEMSKQFNQENIRYFMVWNFKMYKKSFPTTENRSGNPPRQGTRVIAEGNFLVGDVRDVDRLHRAFYKVDIIVHAAALKIVPTAEYNPFEVVMTNTNAISKMSLRGGAEAIP